TLFWIEYFYGDKNAARKHFAKDFTIKKSVAYLNTFLPANALKELTGLRLKQRAALPRHIRIKFKEELNRLLK
ncbi:MAG: hypothetical protein M3P82_06610, partial [Bacteroidota bacterium]|nr:hypothetical protein [Bacteroidota bacterium]